MVLILRLKKPGKEGSMSVVIDNPRDALIKRAEMVELGFELADVCDLDGNLIDAKSWLNLRQSRKNHKIIKATLGHST